MVVHGLHVSSCSAQWAGATAPIGFNGRLTFPNPRNARANVSLRIIQRKGAIHGLESCGGNWKQVKGKVKEQWGKLTDDDLDVIAGKRDQLEGKLQERYGYAKDRAQKEMNDWYGRQTW